MFPRAHSTFCITVVVASTAVGVALAQPTASDERSSVAVRAGADFGISRLSNETFWQLNATALLRFGPVRFDLAAPLRFSIGEFRFREEDYAQPRDAFRVLRCARIDVGDFPTVPDRFDPTCEPYRDPDHVNPGFYASLRMSPLRNRTLGHGTLLGGFNNSLDPNLPQAGATLDVLWREYGHVHVLLDDITRPRVYGGTLSFRPIRYELSDDGNRNTSELQFNAGIVGDLAAPLHVRGAFGVPARDPEGNLVASTTALTAVTADLHYMHLFDACPARNDLLCNTFVFAHVDYNRFLEVEDGDGLHGKGELRFDLYERLRGPPGDDEVSWRPTWGVHAGVEYRNLGSRYQPTYFDGNYSVQRDQFALTSAARNALGADALTTTKLEWLLARPLGREHGFQGYLQVFFPIPTAAGRAPSRLPFTLRVEDASGPLRAAVTAELGPFRMDQVTLGAEFLRRNFDSLADVFSLDGAMIRVQSSIALAPQSGPNASSSLLGGMVINLFYNRRFLRAPNGSLDATNDFMVTLGTSTAILGGSR
jgi:hypothetical protein